MTATIELNSARKKLSSALGESSESLYFNHLKNWFRKRISKETFDSEARKILGKEHSHLHNEFLLAILNKCQTLANFVAPNSTIAIANKPLDETKPVKVTSGIPNSIQVTLRGNNGNDRVKRGKIKTKKRSNKAQFDQRFQQVDCSSDNINSDPTQKNMDELHHAETELKYCFKEPTLPDVSLVHGRMLVAAWESSLNGVEDSAVQLVVKAVENQLMMILAGLVMQKRGYRTCHRRFPHTLGARPTNPWLRNHQNRNHEDIDMQVTEIANPIGGDGDVLVPAHKQCFDDAEQKAIFELACQKPDNTNDYRSRRPISPFDLLQLLQQKRSIIPCHSVHAKNVERVIARLHHPGHDE